MSFGNWTDEALSLIDRHGGYATMSEMMQMRGDDDAVVVDRSNMLT